MAKNIYAERKIPVNAGEGHRMGRTSSHRNGEFAFPVSHQNRKSGSQADVV